MRGSALDTGPDAIKEALAKLGLKTGGTLRQRAERLFLTRDVPLTELDRKHFVKGAAPASMLSEEERGRQHAMILEAALLEAKVRMVWPAWNCVGANIPAELASRPQMLRLDTSAYNVVRSSAGGSSVLLIFCRPGHGQRCTAV